MKKSRTSLFRILILSLVMLVTIFILILAWFSTKHEASASGMSVKAKSAEGLEVSFQLDGEYSSNITVENPHAFPLITTNGIITSTNPYDNFFLPTVDRSSGKATRPAGVWGVKRQANVNEDFLEAELYFRSRSPLDVSLDIDSSVSPITFENGSTVNADGNIINKSDFGEFSKNYIAGAARVGFYDEDDNLQFIWAPNNKYQLTDSGDYAKIVATGDGSGGSANLPGDYNYTPKLYLHERFAQGRNTSDTKQHTMMTYDINTNMYYGLVDVVADANVDHMVAVSTSDAEDPTILNRGFSNSDIVYDFQVNSIKATVEVEFDGTYNADGFEWPKMYHKMHGISKQEFKALGYESFKVLVAYKPTNPLVSTPTYTEDHLLDLSDTSYADGTLTVRDFAYYNSKDPSLNGGGNLGGYDFGTTKSYTIDTDKSVLIAATDGENRYGLALENGAVVTRKIGSSSDTIIPYVSSEFLFTATWNEENQENKGYTFKSINSGKYLSINSNGQLVLAQTQTVFKLNTGQNGPLLSYNGYYIGYASGEFRAVSDITAKIEIFQGNSYSFNSAGTAQTEYKCLEKKKSVETDLLCLNTNVNTISELQSNATVVDNLNFIEGVPLVTLAQDSATQDDEYYRGHIKVRIWVEGTDREAKTPLALGVFRALLNFTGAPTPTTGS